MITKIFIETKNAETPEYVFLQTFLRHLRISPETYELVPLNGKDNLPKAVNQFQLNSLEGGRNLIIFDADTVATHGGFSSRLNKIQSIIKNLDLQVHGVFLYPNHHDDGIFENILENILCRETHQRWWDCYSDYEKCLGDDYLTPNLKGKIFTYISAQKDISNTKRKKFGQGRWLFENSSYWNLDSPYLEPFKDFLLKHLL